MRRTWLFGIAFIGLGSFSFFAAGPAKAQIAAPGGQSGGNPVASLSFGSSGSRTPYVRQRLLQGVVRSENGKPLPDAIVYLKNTLTNQVDTILPDNTGAYRFDQLNFGADYQLWAQNGKQKSAVTTLSSFDTRDQLTINLTIP